MIVTFWGVRGSVAVPGHETSRYGGNTSCVSVEIDGRVLFLDAGTGIRVAGDSLEVAKREIFIALSHLHADHIQGFPYFAPLWDPSMTVYLPDFEHAGRRGSLLDLLDGVHLPVRPSMVRARVVRSTGDLAATLVRHGWDVETLALNHPGGALGWRVRHADRTFVHVTDNELRATEPTATFEECVAFCRGADLLSHDAQWLEGEMPEYCGWGHSSVEQACELAIAADVKTLVLFHHDPRRTDEAVDALLAAATAVLRPHGIQCVAASEGLRVELF